MQKEMSSSTRMCRPFSFFNLICTFCHWGEVKANMATCMASVNCATYANIFTHVGVGEPPRLLPSLLAPSSCVSAVFTMKNNEITVGALCSFLGTPLGHMTCSSRETLLEIINS